jgi:hypothetical protein
MDVCMFASDSERSELVTSSGGIFPLKTKMNIKDALLTSQDQINLYPNLSQK